MINIDNNEFKNDKFKLDDYFALMIIPFINAITHSTAGFFIGETASFDVGLLSPGYIRGAVVLFFIIYVLIFKKIRTNVSKSTFYFGIYVVITTLWSPIFLNSLYVSIKVLSWSACFAIGYLYISTFKRLEIFLKFYILNYFLIFFGVLISNLFNIGWGWYSGEEIRTGGQGAEVVTHFGHLFIFLPLFIRLTNKAKWKHIAYILIGLGAMYIAFAGKRGTFLGIISILLIYLLFSQQRKYLLRLIPILILASIIFMTTIWDIASREYAVREKSFQLQHKDNIETEARYHEILNVTKAVTENIQVFFWGYGFFSELKYSVSWIGRPRMNHIDFFSVLFGTGFIGLLWFLITHYQIVNAFYLQMKRLKTLFSHEIYIAILSSVIYLLVVAISGTITNVDHRTNIYMIYGGLLSILMRIDKNAKN